MPNQFQNCKIAGGADVSGSLGCLKAQLCGVWFERHTKNTTDCKLGGTSREEHHAAACAAFIGP
jgi:hypothetical protein